MILLILSAVSLAGFLGYILWNNSSKKPKVETIVSTNDNTNNANTIQNNDVAPYKEQVPPVSKTYPASSSNAIKDFTLDKNKLGYNFSFKYPSNWTIEEVYREFTSNDYPTKTGNFDLKILSPTQKTKVIIEVGYMGGIGGSCNPNDYEIAKYGELIKWNVDWSVKINSADYPVVLAELLFSNGNSVTGATTYLTHKVSFENGGDHCQTAYSNFVELKPGFINDCCWPSIRSAYILLADIQNDEGTIKPNMTSQKVISARETDEYKQARDILLSTTYSKL